MKWVEKIYSPLGKVMNVQNFTGLFTITNETSTDIEDLNINPLGIVVQDFSMSKEE